MCSVKTGGTVSAPEVGRQLRGLRTASGRTVASVAADAGLSVPYIANLENGRGHPTVAALGAGGREAGAGGAGGDRVPAALVRLGRTDRFGRAARLMAGALRTDEA